MSKLKLAVKCIGLYNVALGTAVVITKVMIEKTTFVVNPVELQVVSQNATKLINLGLAMLLAIPISQNVISPLVDKGGNYLESKFHQRKD